MSGKQWTLLERIAIALIGLAGLNLVIVVHEFGHFITCKLVGVTTRTFSIGFGPALLKTKLFDTTFQISMLPFGGYVDYVPEEFAAQPYLSRVLIIVAGIFGNFLFGYGIATLLRATLPSKKDGKETETLRTQVSQFLHKAANGRRFIGPIGIINILGKSALSSPRIFCFVLAILSLNVGMFNLLPVPPLDGGKLLMTTIEEIGGPLSIERRNMIQWTLFALFITFLFIIASMRRRQQDRYPVQSDSSE